MQDSPYKQLIVFLFIIVVAFVAISIVSSIIGILIFGMEAATNPSILLNNVNYLRFFQISQSISLFIIPPVVYVWYYQLDKVKYFQLNYIPNFKTVTLSIIATLISQPTISYIGYLNQNIELPAYLSELEKWIRMQETIATEVTELLLSNNTTIDILLNAFIIAVIPAFGEELLFRGGLQPLFIKIFKNKHTGIWLTAIIFSAIHMQFLGFFPRMLLGALFGYLVIYGKSLWLAIICHFINNISAIILYNRYLNEESEGNPLESIDSAPNLIWVVASFVFTIGLLVIIKKQSVKVFSR